MELFAIETGNLKLDGGAMFGVVPKTIWNRLYPADENNRINLSMRCLLIKNDQRFILIDTGIGNKQDSRFFSHYELNGNHNLISSLGSIGLSTNDISDVILTHLHFDHCGGAVAWNADRSGFVPTFPNARYHLSQTQWELAVRPNRREKASFLPENFLPLEQHGQLNLFEHDTDLFPGIRMRLFNGHTMGQAIPFIQYKNQTVVFTADVLALSAHLPLPYIMAYDTQPLVSLDEKEALLNEAVRENYVLFFEHDLYTQCVRLKSGPKGPEVSQQFNLADLQD